MDLFYHSEKDKEIHSCAQKLLSDGAFSARKCQKLRTLDLISQVVFSRLFPSPIPLSRIGSASLRAFRPPPMPLNRLYKVNHAIFRQHQI